MNKIHPSLNILAVDIDSVKLDPKNARTGHALAQIGKSLDRYGQRKPIVVNKRTGTIEAGNGTWQAAKDLGWDKIAAVFVEDDPETAIGYAIADNRLADISFFDPGSLAEVLEGIDDPFDIPGVSADWLEGLGVGDVFETSDGEEGADTEPQTDRAEELRAHWGVEPGQIWQIGEHRLLCGDSTKAGDVARVMGGEKADCLCWDPPFNVGFRYEGEYSGQDEKTPEDYKVFINKCINHFVDHAKYSYVCFVWQGMTNIKYFHDWFDRFDWRFISIAKGFVQSRPIWLQYATDPVISWAVNVEKKSVGHRDFFYNGQSANTKKTPDRIISGNHPCPRSMEVCEYFIDGWTNKEDIVVDLTVGSGTTLIACENLKRKGRAIEISPAYVAVALQRWADHTCGKPELLEAA